MANFQEIISKICPSATFEEGQTLLVNVPAEDWRKLAVALKENAGLKFDVLTALIGMDWKTHSVLFTTLHLRLTTGR